MFQRSGAEGLGQTLAHVRSQACCLDGYAFASPDDLHTQQVRRGVYGTGLPPGDDIGPVDLPDPDTLGANVQGQVEGSEVRHAVREEQEQMSSEEEDEEQIESDPDK